mgnify:CR=1 FL=1
MDTLDILFAIGRTLLIGTIGLFIAHKGRKFNLNVFNLFGRINRLNFSITYIGLMIIFYMLISFYHTMLDVIVTLPAYWGLRIFIGLCQAILFPFLCTVLSRRLHDLNIGSLPAMVWSFFIIFTYTYTALFSTAIIFNIVLILVALILMILPGQDKPNQYGPPTKRARKSRKTELRKN